jgi:hypothetical protein
MSHVSSPRKGTELTPRVFGTWQEQVNRALRAIQPAGIILHRENGVIWAGQTEFGWFISPNSELRATATVTGARIGGAVNVTPVLAPPNFNIAFDGWVEADDLVGLRMRNPMPGANAGSNVDLVIVVFNP